MSNDFGQWLRIERHRRGIDVDELAKRSGYSRSLIYMIENGRKPATPPVINAIEKALKDLLMQRQKPYVLEAALVVYERKNEPLNQRDKELSEVLQRIYAFRNGEEFDLKTGLHHLAHARAILGDIIDNVERPLPNEA